MKVNILSHNLYSVFTADDDFAPMLIVPARSANHAIDRAQLVRVAFPAMRLGTPAGCRVADPEFDVGWAGIGVISEAVLTALEMDVSQVDQPAPCTQQRARCTAGIRSSVLPRQLPIYGDGYFTNSPWNLG